MAQLSPDSTGARYTPRCTPLSRSSRRSFSPLSYSRHLTPPTPAAACGGATVDVAFPFYRQDRHPRRRISRLDRRPASASVNASPALSPAPAHDSRSAWFATPSLWGSFYPRLPAGLSRRFPTGLAFASLRLPAVFNVLFRVRVFDKVGVVKRRAPRTDGPLTHFASPRGEKSGLDGARWG